VAQFYAMAIVEDAGGFAEPVAEPPIIETWGVFSSPCDGVVWDSFHHAWLAQPVTNGSMEPDRSSHEPELFAPAELGMEGAKLAAVRRRRALEAEHLRLLEAQAQPSLPNFQLRLDAEGDVELHQEHDQWPHHFGHHMNGAMPTLSTANDFEFELPAPTDCEPSQAEFEQEEQEPISLFAVPLPSDHPQPSDQSAGKVTAEQNKLVKKGVPRPSPPLQQRSRVVNHTLSAAASTTATPPVRQARSASPTQAAADRRRTRQPRQAVAGAARDPSPVPVQRRTSPPKFVQGGATSSSALPSGNGRAGRSNKSLHTQARRSDTTRRRGAATPQQADFRSLKPSRAGLKSCSSQNSEVTEQFAQLWRELEKVQEEAQRERSEKEELRQKNEHLEKRLDALNKEITAGRIGPSGSRSVPLAEVTPYACLGPPTIKAPSPPKSLTSSFRQVIGDRRETSQGAENVTLSLPVSAVQLRQSLPSQKQRQLLHESGGSNGQLPVQVQHRLVSSTSAVSLSGGRSLSLGAPTSKSPSSPLTDGRATVGMTTAVPGLISPPAGPAVVRAPNSVQVRDVRWSPAMTATTTGLHGIPLMQTVAPTALRGTSPPGARYFLPVTSTSPRV